MWSDDLPVEVAVRVASFLDAAELSRLACTCRFWQHIVAMPTVWQELLVHGEAFLAPDRVPIRERCQQCVPLGLAPLFLLIFESSHLVRFVVFCRLGAT